MQSSSLPRAESVRGRRGCTRYSVQHWMIVETRVGAAARGVVCGAVGAASPRTGASDVSSLHAALTVIPSSLFFIGEHAPAMHALGATPGRGHAHVRSYHKSLSTLAVSSRVQMCSPNVFTNEGGVASANLHLGSLHVVRVDVLHQEESSCHGREPLRQWSIDAVTRERGVGLL